MRLYVISPSSWKKVLSNQYSTVEEEIDQFKYYWHTKTELHDEVKHYINGKSGRMTFFPETKLLPTYLFCFVAGQYLELKLEESKVYNVNILKFREFLCRSIAQSHSLNT